MKKRRACAAFLAASLAVPLAAFESDIPSPVAVVSSEDVEFLSITRHPSAISKLPTNLSVFRESDIAATGAETLDQAIDRLPGVDVQRTGSLGSFANVRLRGVPASSQTQLVIDDQPIGGVSLQFLDLSLFPVELIDRIEIVRGASSVMYGANTIGGVIHVITKKPGEGATAGLGYEAGSFDTHIGRASAGGSRGRVGAFGTATAYESDGFQRNGYAEHASGSLAAGYSFAGGARVAFEGYSADHESGNPKGTTLPIGQWDGEKERTPSSTGAYTRQEYTLARLRGDLPVGDLGALTSVAYYGFQDYKSYIRRGLAPDYSQDNTIAGGDARFRLFSGLTIGGSYERDDQNTVGSDPQHVTDWAAYAQQELSIGRISFLPAVRYDEHSEFGSVTNPRFTVVYRVTPRWSVSANAARSFRAPSFLELFYRDPFGFFNGNPDLKPEKAWTYDLGNRIALPAGQELAVTGFFTKIEDRIAAGLSTYENISKAEIRGVEFEASGSLGVFRDRISYVVQDARGNLVNPFTGEAGSTFVPLRLTPRQTAAASLTWAPGRYSFTNEVRYVAEQFRLDDRRGTRLPPYAVWNAQVNAKVGAVGLGAGVDNILAERYGESFDFHPDTFETTINPQPGRTFWGSVELAFGSAGR